MVWVGVIAQVESLKSWSAQTETKKLPKEHQAVTRPAGSPALPGIPAQAPVPEICLRVWKRPEALPLCPDQAETCEPRPEVNKKTESSRTPVC